MPGLNVYFIINAILLVMGIYLFFKTTPDLMKKSEDTAFKTFIIIYGAYIILNSIWTMQEQDVINLPRWLFKTVCALSLIGVLSNAFCFYRFLAIHFGYLEKTKRLYKILGTLPYIIVVLLVLTSIWTNIVFSVTDSLNIKTELGYISLPICALFYFGIIIVRSAIEAKKTKSPQARRNSNTMILTTIILMIWIFFDNLIDSFTIIPIAIFFVLLVIFTTFQQSGINTDALTQMNNRRKAIEYLTIQLDNVSNDSPIYLYICDINSFKLINDTFGHLEGDNAIITLADAIKEEIEKMHGFAARYGGDEFIITIKPQNNNYDEASIINNINDSVKAKCENMPYEVSITAGYVKCSDKAISLETYLKEADQMLYQNKEKREHISPIKE